jgi:hypothetical protein
MPLANCHLICKLLSGSDFIKKQLKSDLLVTKLIDQFSKFICLKNLH